MDVSLPASGPSVDGHDGTLLYPEKPKKCEHIPISGKIKYIILYITIYIYIYKYIIYIFFLYNYVYSQINIVN